MKRVVSAILMMGLASMGISVLAAPQSATDAQQQQLQTLLQEARQQQPQSPSAQQQQPATTAATTTVTNAPPASAAAREADGAVAGTPLNAVDTGGDIRQEAFASMTQSQLPMTPDQIRTFRKLFDETQRAVAEYPGIPPKPTSSSIAVNLTPGATPPVIRLQSGFVTALVFVDATGAAWPIRAIDIGDPSAFDVQWDQKGNTLLVQAITQYRTANLAVQLKGLNTPIMMTLIPGQAAVDYRVDLHIPALGPNASPSMSGLPAAESPTLLNVLSGIPPLGSKTLTTAPAGYADVWLVGNMFYIRTRATVLSPAWVATMSSSDGTHAYKMPIAPLVIVSLNGKPVNLNISGY